MIDILKGQRGQSHGCQQRTRPGSRSGKGGTAGAQGSLKKRYKGTKHRANRVSWLNKKNKKARALYATGVSPQATYGAETTGFSPKMVDYVKTMGADVVGTRKWEGALSRP